MRVVHLSHHPGCRDDVRFVGRHLGFEVVDFAFDDGYNIGPERAARAWRRHGELLSSFDWAIVSDTAPLSRILLQNGYRGRLVIWICNRFDYADRATNDCGFPDPGYYELFAEAARSPKVAVVGYTEFEHVYARRKGIETGGLTIPPVGATERPGSPSPIPASLDRERTFLVPPYGNNRRLVDLEARCRSLGIPAYRGRYAGPADLRGFRGIIHIPYAWSNFALFESLRVGVPTLIPSPAFLLRLSLSPRFFWSPPFVRRKLGLSEWYRPEHRRLFITFRSWRDLRRRTLGLDPGACRERLRSFAAAHAERVLGEWKAVFRRLGAEL